MEKDIEQTLVKGIKELGGRAYKFTSPGCAGMPDRLILFKKLGCMFVEVKSENGRLSKMQAFRIKELKTLGFNVQVVYGRLEVLSFLAFLKNALEEDKR
jgi:hypothetical protein